MDLTSHFERLTLGGCLLEPATVFPAVREILHPDDFADPMHREIYDAMLDTERVGFPVDVNIVVSSITKRLSDRTRRQAILDMARTIVTQTPIPNHAPYYARAIVERRVQREAIAVSEQLADAPDSDAIDKAMATLAKNRERLELIVDRQQQTTKGRFDDVTIEWLGRITTEGDLAGIPLACEAIDDAIGGPLPIGSYIVVGAAPSNGKTIFQMQTCYRAAKAGHKVVFYSQEMTADAICERIVSTITGHRRNQIGSWNRAEIAKQVMEFFAAGGDIEFRRCDPNVSSIVADMRLQAKRGVTVVCVDYLGMLKAPGKRSTYEEISEITNTLKAATTQLNITTIVGCQLNKEAMREKPPIPNRQHLKDSSAMFENADAVFLLRYPKTDTPIEQLQPALNQTYGTIDANEYFECYVRKLRNRELPSAVIPLRLMRKPLQIVPLERSQHKHYSAELESF